MTFVEAWGVAKYSISFGLGWVVVMVTPSHRELHPAAHAGRIEQFIPGRLPETLDSLLQEFHLRVNAS